MDWVDRATGGEPTLYLGQQIIDANPIWLLEFWNPSIEKIWSLDGSAPLPSLSPDLGAPDGTLSPAPDVSWVVTSNGVEVVGARRRRAVGGMTLFRVRPPVRFRYAQTGSRTGRLDGCARHVLPATPPTRASRAASSASSSRARARAVAASPLRT